MWEQVFTQPHKGTVEELCLSGKKVLSHLTAQKNAFPTIAEGTDFRELTWEHMQSKELKVD